MILADASTTPTTLIAVAAAVIGVLLVVAGAVGVWLAIRTGQNTQTLANFREAAKSWREKAEALQSDLDTVKQELAGAQAELTDVRGKYAVLEGIVTGKAEISALASQVEHLRGDILRGLDGLESMIRTGHEPPAPA